MPAEELRNRYVGLLLDRFSATRYPSAPMMDRIEAAVTDRRTAEEYVSRLLEAVEGDRFPSPTMLERANRLIARLEAAPEG